MFQVFGAGELVQLLLGSELCVNSYLQKDALSLLMKCSRSGSSDHRDISSVRLPKTAEPS